MEREIRVSGCLLVINGRRDNVSHTVSLASGILVLSCLSQCVNPLRCCMLSGNVYVEFWHVPSSKTVG
jgi:hypothetical protein